jgi:hypothetical protein
MRRVLIRTFLPLVFCIIPMLAAVLVAAALPEIARRYYIDHLHPIDWLILAFGVALFAAQMLLTWRALRGRGSGFDERWDRWLSNLAQAAEWFPMLGLLGTVAGILQTFSQIHTGIGPDEVIRLYAPAITATGSGLFMALINILPTWVVLIGRELIGSLGGEPTASELEEHDYLENPKSEITTNPKSEIRNPNQVRSA